MYMPLHAAVLTTSQLIAAKPVVVEVTESDKSTATFEVGALRGQEHLSPVSSPYRTRMRRTASLWV